MRHANRRLRFFVQVYIFFVFPNNIELVTRKNSMNLLVFVFMKVFATKSSAIKRRKTNLLTIVRFFNTHI